MSENSYVRPSKVFDWIFIICAGLWTAGAYIDGFAHIHLNSELETFFTLWHAVFYLGIFLTGGLLLGYLFLNYKKGYPLRFALPKEYLFSFAGVAIALVGGVGDFLWHQTFGIEEGIEALLSPTHLLLAIGGAMAVAGPLYAIWYRPKSYPIDALPTILSATYFLSVITFMLQFLHPLNLPWMAESFLAKNPLPLDFAAMLGVANILFFTILFVSFILSTVRHWLFPFGSFLVIFSLNAAAMTLMRADYYYFIITAAVAGLAIDFLYLFLIKQPRRKMSHIHLFCFLAPVAFFSVYILTILLTDKIIWSVHMWTGSIVISGIVGYLMSYLVIPSENKAPPF